MLKKDNVFHWEDQQTWSFQQVKTLIAKANTTPLRYYDRNLLVTVQADASLRGLEACLIQQHKGKDQLIAFASKSLTDTETRCANIERELLAIVFAWDFRDKLSTDDGMFLKGPRLIIPGELQEEYLSRLHEGHLSASKVKENAKQHMYWTGIDVDIEDYTKRCQECIKRSQVAKEPLQPHDIPEGPWRKLGIDYFAFDCNSYVLICDYFSKFPFLYRAKTSFWSLRDRLIDLFSIEGYRDEIVSDNGPPFQSKEFAKFLSGLGIKHTTSSPGYPRSNGFIERHIQTVKNMLSKSSNTWSFQEVLADLRTTRIGTELPSPAEILHGRNLTTRVQAEIDIKAIHSVLQERQLKMTLDHDTSRRAKKARPLVVGERCHV